MKVSHLNPKTVAANGQTALRRNAAGLERQAEALMDAAIDLALKEDIGDGDITTLATVAADKLVSAEVWLKQEAVVAGLPVFSRVFSRVDPRVTVEFLIEDGARIDPPAVIARLKGPARSIVTGERVALNFLQRLSGIATETRRFVDLAGPHGIAILDTRKTTPGLRAFERYAVRAAGGTNHRFDLCEALLVKDNHVSLAGSVTEAARRARLFAEGRRLEVEVTNLDELQEALSEKVDAVLLDNMTPEQVRQSVAVVAGKCFVEVSGGIRLENIEQYLIPGVSAISIGGITHSARSIDISLEIEA